MDKRAAMDLSVSDLTVAFHGKPIVSNASLRVDSGQFVGLLGPNGSGKSTLLRTICRLNRSYKGTVLWSGADARSIPLKEFARSVAVVSQFNAIAFDFSVIEVVLMGRSPHLSMMSRESKEDLLIAEEALKTVELSAFRDRSFSSLSGGEKQRALLARALAQQPSFLVLDEPTNHLDIKHQLNTLAIVRNLGISCLAALHDLEMASRFVDRVYFMKDGSVRAGGEPRDVITSEAIEELYEVRSRVTPREEGGVAIEYRYPTARRAP